MLQSKKKFWFLMGLLVITFYILAKRFDWGWTGFFPYETTTKTNVCGVTETHPGKTLWDFLELVIIPVVLAVGASWFNRVHSENEQKIASQQRKNEQKITSNQQEELLLQNYIDAMTELILEKRLRVIKKDSVDYEDLKNIARARTLTVLRALITTNMDGKNRRRGSLIRFLHETKLINKENSIISLMNANIEEAYMRKFDLRDANLQGASMYKADLRGAVLKRANLENAYLVKTKLQGADFTDANLHDAKLTGAFFGEYRGEATKWPDDDFAAEKEGAIRKDIKESKDLQKNINSDP